MSEPSTAGQVRARVLPTATASAAASGLEEVLLVTNSPVPVADKPWLRSFTWGEKLPNFTDFLAVIVEVPQPPTAGGDLAPLLQEIAFARAGGTIVAWLITPESSDDFIASTTGLSFIRLREPSQARLARPVDRAFAKIAAAISSFQIVLQPDKGWQPLVTLPAGGASILVGQRNPRGGAIDALALSLFAADRLAAASVLGEWVQAELRQRSGREAVRRGLARLAVALTLGTAFLYTARVLQRHQNLHLGEDESYVGSISNLSQSVKPGGDYGDSKWLAHFDLPVDKLDTDTLEEQLAMALWIADDAREDRLLRQLLAPERASKGARLAASHFGRNYADAIRFALESGDFERARYLAQRFINAGRDLPYWVGFQQNYQFSLNAMRKLVDLLRPNFAYANRELVQLLSLDAVDGGGGIDSRLPPIVNVDPTLADNVEYAAAIQAAAENYQRILRRYDAREGAASPTAEEDVPRPEMIWQDFARTHPTSEKRDAAAFNALNEIIGALGTTDDARSFVASYPSSYLADDALFYVVRLSVEWADYAAAARAFAELARTYPESDSLRRLQYLMVQMPGWEPDEKKRQLIEQMTALAAAEPPPRGSKQAPPNKDLATFLERSLGRLHGPDWNE